MPEIRFQSLFGFLLITETIFNTGVECIYQIKNFSYFQKAVIVSNKFFSYSSTTVSLSAGYAEKFVAYLCPFAMQAGQFTMCFCSLYYRTISVDLPNNPRCPAGLAIQRTRKPPHVAACRLRFRETTRVK